MSTCPNKDILSAYIDGEVPVPWKGSIEQHLQQCAVCKGIYDQYVTVHRYMQISVTGAELDMDASFAKLIEKRNAILQNKSKVQKRQWGVSSGERWFSSSIRIPVFFKIEYTVNSVAAVQSSFTPIIPVSLEKQKPISEIDYGITHANSDQSYTVSTKAVNTNAKFFTVGEFARLYSKDESLFQPVESTVDLKISSSSFPLSSEYQSLYIITDPNIRISNR